MHHPVPRPEPILIWLIDDPEYRFTIYRQTDHHNIHLKVVNKLLSTVQRSLTNPSAFVRSGARFLGDNRVIGKSSSKPATIGHSLFVRLRNWAVVRCSCEPLAEILL